MIARGGVIQFVGFNAFVIECCHYPLLFFLPLLLLLLLLVFATLLYFTLIIFHKLFTLIALCVFMTLGFLHEDVRIWPSIFILYLNLLYTPLPLGRVHSSDPHTRQSGKRKERWLTKRGNLPLLPPQKAHHHFGGGHLTPFPS